MLLSTAAEPNSLTVDSAISTVSAPFWDPGSILICTLGLAVMVIWLFWFEGFGALRHAPARRNRLHPAAPVLLFAVWLMMESGFLYIIGRFFADRPEFFQQAIAYPPMIILRIGMIVAMLTIASQSFARGLKGFGLRPRTLGKDMVMALVNLLTIYTWVTLLLWAVMLIGTVIDPEFTIEQHQSLTFLGETDSTLFRVLTAVFAVFIVPVFEELLFRGFLQTSIRSLTHSPWIAIILTSVIFACLHPVWTHIPALIALSCGLGYAYERSGSLFRPILMHIFFNGFSVGLTLLTAA